VGSLSLLRNAHSHAHKLYSSLWATDRTYFDLAQVSHWGRVYVEERYKVRNVGTEVTPPFARWNLTLSRGRDTALWALPMLLPKSAKYAYLKDDLGLMQLATASKDSALSAKLLPRYPLLGGWSTEMVLGYSLPLPSTVACRDDVHTVTFLLGPLLEFVRTHPLTFVIRSDILNRLLL
jgi:hypothetical protein